MRSSFARSIIVVAGVGLLAVVVGLTPPARAAVVDAMSCALSTPCLEWDNTSSGDAVKGVSTKGNALHGQTKFKSAGKTSGKAGVFGEDLSTSGNLDAGVSGASTNGAGVVGTSTAWNGMEGLSSGAGTSGVYGQNSATSGYGIAGRNTGTSFNAGGAGVLADGGTNDDGLHAFATGTGATAAYANSTTGISLHLTQGAGDSSDELWLQGNTVGHGLLNATDSNGNSILLVRSDHSAIVNGDLKVFGASGTSLDIGNLVGNPAVTLRVSGGTYGTNTDVLEVDGSGMQQMGVTDIGNVVINGQIFTQGSCNEGCIVGNKQRRRVTEYSALGAEPTIEDNGEARLVNGRADVALDSKFANVIDTMKAYLVSVTPEGDCRGLFVADRTPRGFTVAELQGGHANISFEYRIVAKRYGDNQPRLPMVDLRSSPPRGHRSREGRIVPD